VHVRDVHSLQFGLDDLKGPVREGRCPEGLHLIGRSLKAQLRVYSFPALEFKHNLGQEGPE